MKINRRSLLKAVAAFALPSVALGKNRAWPAQQIRIIVPYAPGGTADLAARVVFERVGPELGQQFIIENRPGGGGTIGMNLVARAAPDGYTFVLAADSAVFRPLIEAKPTFVMERDFVPVSLFVAQPLVLAVHKDIGINSVGELIKKAKDEPGSLAYGISGIGSTHHIAAELFCEKAGVQMTAIPYKGGGQAVTDLASGQIPVAFLGAGPIVGYANSGKLRMLAVTSRLRSPSLPQVPSLDESGIKGIDITQWFGLYGPMDTPVAITEELQRAVYVAMQLPSIKNRLASIGIDAHGDTGAMLAERQIRDGTLWLDTSKRLGITVGT